MSERLTRHDRLFFVLAGAGSAVLAVALFLGLQWRWEVEMNDKSLLLVIAVSTFTIFYRFPLLLSARRTLYMARRAIGRWINLMVIVLMAYFLVPSMNASVPREMMELWALLTLPVLLLALIVMRKSALGLYASASEVRKAIFLLPGDEANLLGMRLRRSPVLGIEVAGYYGEPPSANPDRIVTAIDIPPPLPRLGDLNDALKAISTNTYHVVFVGMRVLQQEKEREVAQALGNSTASIYLVPEARLFGYFTMASTDIAGVPLLALHENHILGLSRLLKRTVDLVLSAIALTMLAPIMLMIALGIRFTSPGPVFFRQARYGLNGEAIQIFKFRSMHTKQTVEESTMVKQAVMGDPRVTKLGRFLRKSSLDELPQLFNVLMGDMSLVGPRPHAAAHNEMYRSLITGYMLRHTVKPGITGWAQVNGLRGETETLDKMRRRIEYDHHYIQNWSLNLDIRIMFMTLRTLFWDKAAY
ncbi:undecaprenyl-phosphate glucose phosphotransferase [Pigmentiphaga aceris]|nr:undecaprenyl-phosphate glucose phosphotransferase [Pigmentiphaga aceris]